jgi:hypothetical protein
LVAFLLPAAQLGEFLEQKGVHVFHLPVAVASVTLDVAVFACGGDQTHEYLPAAFNRIVFD